MKDIKGYIQVRIKEGALIGQDMASFNWPKCKPPESEYPVSDEYQYITNDPDAIFYAKWNGRWWNCIKHGFGALPRTNSIQGDYGNGSIFAMGSDSVTIVGENENT